MQVTEVSTSDQEQARVDLDALFSQRNKSFVVQQLVPQCSQVKRDVCMYVCIYMSMYVSIYLRSKKT